MFSDWYGDGLDIWEPFLVPVVLENNNHFDLFDLSVRAETPKPDFYSTTSAWWEVSVEDQKIPSTATMNGPDGSGEHGVAYNLDAIKLANSEKVKECCNLVMIFCAIRNVPDLWQGYI